MRLENKVAVVTGASSGMGYEIVKRFTEEGADVVAVARRLELLEKLKQETEGNKGRLIVMQGDVTEKEVNEKMIDLAVSEFGKLDILVNNAGIMDDMAGVADYDEEKFDRIMKLNVNGPLMAMKKAVNVMKEQGHGGSIINMASVGGMRSVAGIAYTTSKAAVISMTKNTAWIYQPHGIRCNAIAPGGIKTDISKSMGVPNAEGWERTSKLFAAAPEMGEARDVANAVLFLASDESKYISGDTIVVDGGWLAG